MDTVIRQIWILKFAIFYSDGLASDKFIKFSQEWSLFRNCWVALWGNACDVWISICDWYKLVFLPSISPSLHHIWYQSLIYLSLRLISEWMDVQHERPTKIASWRTEEISHLVKCLTGKLKDLSSDPAPLWKLGTKPQSQPCEADTEGSLRLAAQPS